MARNPDRTSCQQLVELAKRTRPSLIQKMKSLRRKKRVLRRITEEEDQIGKEDGNACLFLAKGDHVILHRKPSVNDESIFFLASRPSSITSRI